MSGIKAAGFAIRIQNFLSFERLFFCFIILAAILRFAFLDLKLFHHDEAIHAWFSYKLLTTGVYLYDPSFHGPLLYYVTSGMFSAFGDSDLVGRIIPALLGTLIVVLLYPLYRLGYLDQRQTLVAALFLAISPNMVYFSRFLRNDIFILFLTFVLLLSLILYLERGQMQYAALAAVATGLGLSCKENMPIVLGIFGAYLIYLVWSGKVTLPRRWIRDLALGALITIGIVAVMYSSFGVHPERLITFIPDAFLHWWDMHEQQRLGGPFFFYILLFLLYEVPIFLLAIAGTVQFIQHGRHKQSRETAKRTMHEIVGIALEQIRGHLPEAPRSFDKKEEFFRFCIVWWLLSIVAYAYIGEKVPWLLIHQLLPTVLVATYAMTRKKAIIAVLSSIFLVFALWHVAYVPADVNEPIVQVQNSEDLREVMALIDASESVAVASDRYWPLPWYYRGDRSENLNYFGKRIDEGNFAGDAYDLVITSDEDSYASLPGFEKRQYNLNYWFSWYDNKDRIAQYYFFRDGKMGNMKLEVFVRNATV
ncbi:flippase activity-associated protein Agl23 [Methanofollis fontis]|uniref:TIGR03663 family protein n=1 Tax=Methanofollis fontis TaxID=2052832 RepID=A0A483CSN0_9EURY|nr:flippase activity-associated protein Agl23 [Methanofollis fontis]TAJ44201.1 TIGR03663 family protein [Methanofollis fontis]